jgi:translation elongation factor EF-1alpha
MEEQKQRKEVEIGEIMHFFPHVNAAVIKLKAALAQGDTVHIKGHTTDFEEPVTSMQVDNQSISSAKKGDEVGLLVKEKVRKGDIVYKIA